MGAPVSEPTQAKRHIRLATPLGDDVLIPISVRGHEAMSSLFRFDLRVYSTQKLDLQPGELIAQPVTLALVKPDQSFRYFNGIVSELEALGRRQLGKQAEYRLTVVPALWLLSHTRDYRVFQDIDVADLIREVLHPYRDEIKYQINLRQSHPKRRFLTQHRESDLDFLLRWLRKENVAFYFTHSNGQHALHFVDDPNVLPPLDPQELLLQPDTAAHEQLSGWCHSSRFVPGAAEQCSFNYKQPDAPVSASAPPAGELAAIPRTREIGRYRYAGSFGNAIEANADTRRWQIRGAERHQVVHGAGSYHHLEVARHFKASHPQKGGWADEGKEFTLFEVAFEASDQEPGGEPFLATFSALPRGGLIYPASAGWPLIHGLQTAVVVGPPGEEIHTDALGRVKVRFHWDRLGNEKGQPHETSCWLRVMQQGFAGPGYGFQATPRIGQEVVVAFEEGNPDRPFILGTLYHELHRPPYPGPGKASQYGIKGRSTKGGGPNNFNELRFDDKKGQEEIFVQAERDLNVDVKRNETRDVGDSFTLTAKNKIHLQVAGNTITIDKSGIKITGGVVDIDGQPVQIN